MNSRNLRTALLKYINARSNNPAANRNTHEATKGLLNAINSEMARATNVAMKGGVNNIKKANNIAVGAMQARGFVNKGRNWFKSRFPTSNNSQKPGFLSRMKNRFGRTAPTQYNRLPNNNTSRPNNNTSRPNNNATRPNNISSMRNKRINNLRKRFGNNSIPANIANNKLNKISNLAQKRSNVNLNTLTYLSMLSPSQLSTYNSLDSNNKQKIIKNYAVSNFNSGYRNIVASKSNTKISNNIPSNGNGNIPKIAPPPSQNQKSNNFANFNRGPLNQQYRNMIPNNKERSNFINYVLARNNKGQGKNFSNLKRNFNARTRGSLINM